MPASSSLMPASGPEEMANLQSSLLWKNSDNSFADEGGYTDGVDGKARNGFEKKCSVFLYL